MELTPALRQRLGRARLIAPGTLASVGVGERRSKQRGQGIEFEEHRRYHPGDDARRIDPNLFARHGTHYVREYNVSRQLVVTLLLDASRSMHLGTPRKFDAARALAAGLLSVALAGSDAVQVGVWLGDRLAWQTRRSGIARLDDIERWWNTLEPDGDSDLATAARYARDHLPAESYTIVVSDFWSDTALAAIDDLAGASQTLLALQLLSPEEVHPERYLSGALRMVDVETNDEVEVTIGPLQADRYRHALGAWTDDLRQRVQANGGRFLRVTTDQNADEVFLRALPLLGVLQ